MRIYHALIAALLVSILFLPLSTFAQSSLTLTLKDAICLALRFNPDVQNAEIQRVIDKVNLQVAHWNFAPHYALTASHAYTNTVSSGNKTEGAATTLTPSTTLLTPIGTQLSLQMQNLYSYNVGSPHYYNPSVTFSFTQPLLQGFAPDVVLAPLHIAENTELINRLTMKITIMETITNVIGQCAALLQAENSLKVQRLSLKNSLAILKQQQAFLKTGRIAEADLVQFKASVASQELLLQQQEVNITQQKLALLTMLGIDPTISITFVGKVRFDDESVPSLADSIRIALENNVAYQQELLNFKIDKINLRVAEDQQRWTLNLTASRTQGGGSGGPPNSGLASLTNGQNSNTSVALNLSVPIDNQQLQQVAEQAKVSLSQERVRLDAAKRQVINSVTNAYITVLSQKVQINQAKIAVDLAQKSLTIAEERLRFGKVTPFEVSTLQTNLITQQLSYINAETAYVTNLATLDQTIGITLQRWNLHLRY